MVKIWDWDSGELERTLRSHTKAVSNCQFDSTGKVSGKCIVGHIVYFMRYTQLLNAMYGAMQTLREIQRRARLMEEAGIPESN